MPPLQPEPLENVQSTRESTRLVDPTRTDNAKIDINKVGSTNAMMVISRPRVGVSRVDGKVTGDVADDVWEVAGWVSPNPKGVGPMTRAMLLTNIVEIAEKSVRS